MLLRQYGVPPVVGDQLPYFSNEDSNCVYSHNPEWFLHPSVNEIVSQQLDAMDQNDE